MEILYLNIFSQNTSGSILEGACLSPAGSSLGHGGTHRDLRAEALHAWLLRGPLWHIRTLG